METPPSPEGQLIYHAHKGDLRAFEQLVSLYEKRIFNYILRMVQHNEDAEDITQETFIKVYKQLHTFDQSKNFKTWLYTIATHTAYDWFRRRRARREFFVIDDPESSFETIGEDVAYKEIEDKEVVGKALRGLKPLHQIILMMYYKDELTYEEIAGHLRIPLNTVKTHLYRAKRALKIRLEHVYGTH